MSFESVMEFFISEPDQTNLLSFSAILIFGLIMGVRHSFESDHIAAVCAMVSQKRKLRHAVLQGMLWGVGHTIALMVVGLALLLFATAIPSWLTSSFEILVGIVLIMLGASLISGFKIGSFFKPFLRKNFTHSHPHFHELGISHTHEHSHDLKHSHSHKPFIIGIIHGLAGSGVMVLFILTSIESFEIAILYLVIFGLGSIASMTGVSAVIGLPFSKFGGSRTLRILTYSAAIFTIGIGIQLIFETTEQIWLF